MSSPHINNLILVGCVIMYSTVIFQELNQDQAAVFCKVTYANTHINTIYKYMELIYL